MDYQALAELLFPHVTETPEEVEARAGGHPQPGCCADLYQGLREGARRQTAADFQGKGNPQQQLQPRKESLDTPVENHALRQRVCHHARCKAF